jgi:hypothetical protein
VFPERFYNRLASKTLSEWLQAMSICSPIASSAHILCCDTQLKAHAAAGVAMANTHAGAIDALALDIIDRCISLKQWCHDEHFVLTTLFHNLP